MTALGQHTVEIAKRPRKTWSQTIQALLFILFFDFGCLMINGFQFTVLLPLCLLPFPLLLGLVHAPAVLLA